MEISASDQKLRLSWLRFTAALLFLTTVGVFFSSEINVLESLFSLFQTVVAFYFFYYFTYRKFGVRWLLLNMIAGAFGCVMLILNEGFEYLQVMTICLFLYWAYQSFRVYRFNKRFQLETIRSSTGYLEAMPIFESVSSLDELNTTFGKYLIAHAHSSSLEEGIVKAYQDRKKFIMAGFNT